jgi:WhiB family transcriptional regulator, redox-sensing transcriptional regulator
VRRRSRHAWQEEAACQDRPERFADADFYPENRRSPEAKLAKQLCSVCPIRLRCLDWALDNNERFGIWGGVDPKERAWLKNPELEVEDADAED